ncbi:sugar O-acyltransferase (sialic acid O-acetyltransferase NeuD family) [Lysobacter niabensis]|uniref:Sugar O-acyltransferase (Sialic acid O-acetyltransferase NeuD family) n=1 Tax=Agrilutibacter niabensis TaxID=380628 RepID=A0ABU1VJT4_9GAMM|nr:acetyltransferase [Lysobacter niabensis]MDR7097742.1 sugar O-acyltransferase (sialic acid O-acetyltransferase NeuD family) [Lysobacter niabensis]
MSGPCNPFHQADPGFRRLYIFGAGGFGREVAWLAEQAWGAAVELQFLVDRPEYLREAINGIPVRLLQDAEVRPDSRFVVAVGDPSQRRAAVDVCTAAGHTPTLLVHPRVETSLRIALGEGAVLCAGTVVTVDVTIGVHAHVNLGCTIGHDVIVGEFSTLSPGVHVSGNVRIGRDVFLGTGACIINGTSGQPLTIGDGAVIAAGACVTRSVEPGAMVAGVPAVRKR